MIRDSKGRFVKVDKTPIEPKKPAGNPLIRKETKELVKTKATTKPTTKATLEPTKPYIRPKTGKRPKIGKMTLKQRDFLKAYFDRKSPTFGNGVMSALKVYNTTDYGSANVIATENLQKLANPTRLLMQARGLSIGKLLGVLEEGLNANRVISAIKTDKQANGATSDFIEVPDHAVRHKYLETAGKFMGIEKSGGVQVNIFNQAKKQDTDFIDIDD